MDATYIKKKTAAMRYLEVKGYEILDAFDEWVVVEDDDGDIAFVYVSDSNEMDQRPQLFKLREWFEEAIVNWFSDHLDLENLVVRCDLISFTILSSDRAILKHHVNAINDKD